MRDMVPPNYRGEPAETATHKLLPDLAGEILDSKDSLARSLCGLVPLFLGNAPSYLALSMLKAEIWL